MTAAINPQQNATAGSSWRGVLQFPLTDEFPITEADIHLRHKSLAFAKDPARGGSKEQLDELARACAEALTEIRASSPLRPARPSFLAPCTPLKPF